MSLKKCSKSASYITTHNFRILVVADWGPRTFAEWKQCGNHMHFTCNCVLRTKANSPGWK